MTYGSGISFLGRSPVLRAPYIKLIGTCYCEFMAPLPQGGGAKNSDLNVRLF